MTLALRFAVRSDVGLLRDGNEDSAYAGPRLLAVADGMGGAAAGEVASSEAIAAIAQLDEDTPGADLITALRNSLREANDRLRRLVSRDPSLEGMGTTLTALLWDGHRLGLVHIGDSRCYLLRDGELSQITHDHTLVQQFVDEGHISEDEAASHPQRSVITRALDGRAELEPDLSVREVQVGDRYLLCSDGLSGVVSSDTMLDALRLPDPGQACEQLVDLALRGGGPDNITCIVADVVEDTAAFNASPVVAGAATLDPDSPLPSPATAAGRAALARLGTRPRRRSAPAPRASGHRRRFRWTAVLLVLLLVLVGLGVAGYAWDRTQWYVGTTAGANPDVAIYHGIHASVAGVKLSSVSERTTVPVDVLDSYDRQQLASGIPVSGPAAARTKVSELRGDACTAVYQTYAVPPSAYPAPALTTPPTPSKTPVVTSGHKRATPRPTPAVRKTPKPSPSPTLPAAERALLRAIPCPSPATGGS